MSATLTAKEVGAILGYTPDRVRAMYRAGNLPGPIDASLPTGAWRWSLRVITRYIDGDVADSPVVTRPPKSGPSGPVENTADGDWYVTAVAS